MKKFMVLYMAPAAVIAEMMKASPEQMKAEMDDWMSWQEKHKSAVVDMGAPLGKTKRLAAGGGLSDTRNDLTGYAIVQGDSVEAVAATFRDHPHLKIRGTYIDILDCVDINAMMPA
jgi:hypothetical protein